MSLDKAIKQGREHRKPYYKSKQFDTSCRPNQGCPACKVIAYIRTLRASRVP